MQEKPITRINGSLFEQMVKRGLKNLIYHEREINALNVFPVADGDTGTNMRLTLENGIQCAGSDRRLCVYLKALSSGMLLGARGNSGVILSQLFKGIYLELSRSDEANPAEMRNALIRGYKVAYEAVVNPVEGTILTVAREGIEKVVQLMKRVTDMSTLFQMYLSSMEASLETTPEHLQLLAEMGVVDSGAKGYIIIMQGMVDQLLGRAEQSELQKVQPSEAPAPALDLSAFDENSSFEDGYCTEFLLQLMNAEQYVKPFSTERFIEELSLLGDSLVVVENEMRVKVHIHSRNPAPIIQTAQKYGEFLTFKLENMQIQHNENQAFRPEQPAKPLLAQSNVHKSVAVVAVVNGDGMQQTFSELGCSCVLDGGPTMNASTNDFVDAIRSQNADTVVILPDNPNMMLAAEQAVKMCAEQNVVILPSCTVPEGYSALAMDIPDSNDIQARIKHMERGIKSIRTLNISQAVKDYDQNGVACKVGDFIATNRDGLLSSSGDPVQTVMDGLMQLDGIDDMESCIFFRGTGGNESAEAQIEEAIMQRFPMMECSFLYGGQDIFQWIIGVM